MSGKGHQENSGQERVGALLKRHTLALLGLDELDQIDQSSRDTLASAERFAASLGRRVQRLQVGASLHILAGTPEFLHGVQERYLPLAVDPSFGLLKHDGEGPRTPADLGPWRKLLDAVHLILFDEDEEGDFVSWAPHVRRQQVQQAVASMARRRELPAMAALAHQAPRRQPTSHATERVQVADRVQSPAPDYLTISESIRASLFAPAVGPSIGASHLRQPGAPLGAARRTLSAQSTFAPVRPTSEPRSSALMQRPGAVAAQGASLAMRLAARVGGPSESGGTGLTSPIGHGILSSLRAMRPSGFTGTSGASRFTSIDALGSHDPRMAGAGFASLGQALTQQAQAYGYLGAAPGSLLALVPEALTPMFDAAQPNVAPAMGTDVTRAASQQRSEFLGMSRTGHAVQPASQQRQVGHVGSQTAFVSSYPASMGRAGMRAVGLIGERQVGSLGASLRGSDLIQIVSNERPHALDAPAQMRREPAVGPWIQTAPGRAGGGSSLAAPSLGGQLRERLIAYARHIGVSAQHLQHLADEPTALFASLLASADARGSRAHIGSRQFEASPRLPSSLGFSRGDLLAPYIERLLRTLDAAPQGAEDRAGYLGFDRDAATLLRPEAPEASQDTSRADAPGAVGYVPFGANAQAAIAKQLHLQSPALTLTARAAQTVALHRAMTTATRANVTERGVRLDAEQRATRDSTKPSAIFGDMRLSSSYLPSLVESLRHVARAQKAGQTTGSAARSSAQLEERAQSRLGRMLSTLRIGGAETAEARALLAQLRASGSAAPSTALTWSGDQAYLQISAQEVVRAERLKDTGLSPKALLAAELAGATVLSPREVVSAAPREAMALNSNVDISRFLGFNKAIRHLVPEVATKADPTDISLLRRVLEGELTGQPTQDHSPARLRGQVHDVREGLGFSGDRHMLSLRSAAASDQRSKLSLREPVGSMHTPARHREAPVAASSAFEANLDLARLRPIGVAGHQAQSYAPKVLGLERFEERVEAELAATRGDRAFHLPGDEPSATVQLTGDTGETVKIGYSPRSLAKLMEHRATEGAEGIPLRILKSVMQEALARPGATPTTMARELERRIGGLSLQASPHAPTTDHATTRQLDHALSIVDRALVRHAQRKATQRGPGTAYFESIVPTGFDTKAPSRLLAEAFREAPRHSAQREVTLSTPALTALEAAASRSQLSLAPSDSPLDGARGVDGLAQRPLRLSTPSSTFDVVRPGNLSRLLSRFSPEPQGLAQSHQASAGYQAGSMPPGQTRFASQIGEPGQLVDRLESFVPSGASLRQKHAFEQSKGGYDTGGLGTVLQSSATPPADGSLAHALETLRSQSPTGSLLGATALESGSPSAPDTSSPMFTQLQGLGEFFSLGSGGKAQSRGSRYEADHLIRRVESVLDRAERLSRRPSLDVGSDPLAALIRAGVQKAEAFDEGLPAWRREAAQVQGVDVAELREMLRQVGAVPVQGQQTASDRSLVNPYIGQSAVAQGVDPLFRGEPSGAETKPTNEVQNQEQAFAAADAGVPPYEDLVLIAEEVYKHIMEKFRDEMQRRRSD